LRNLIGLSAVGAIATALLIAGCGGGGEDGADAQQIDKAAFIEQADAICKQASGRMAAEVPPFAQREAGRNFTKIQILITQKVLIPGLEEEQRQIQALGIPEEAKNEAEALLKAYRMAIDRIKAETEAVVNNETEPQEAIVLAARRIGIARCPVAAVTGS
jgi:hypothetical protein